MPILLPFGDDAPDIAPDAFVAASATLIGKVRLGAGSSVFFGAVLRADRAAIELGDRSNIQDNVSVHGDEGIPVLIGSGVSVGHGAVVHGCTVEDDCLIGMGAIVLNGAVIGAGSLVAAGAVVLEGTVIPPGSLVAGVPGKVRRELTGEEQAGIRSNAATYLELSRAYLTAPGS
ncbi:MAG: gamma carbonic anhydrase family protein [Naasia sp.]|jgi:carbonic anhydrase/acetyltransferase-like protein (isoleucine patch superfamily)|uniref:gamma carbonic anhydrase family protein n=1 Tax=Naasia sp. TaxID=2546198 RepID=UPI0026061961|nr:gamma carbonic anhydrase family protein [Naasia sp.]MCU1571233.1 gamma carbonic anhydrase family protein [Naasia sp.]